MIHYFYDPNTFEYRGSMPGSGVQGAGAPDFSTTVGPENRPGYAAFRNVEAETWEYVEDHRGKTAFAKDLSSAMFIDTVGILPEEFTLIPPPLPMNNHQIQWSKKKKSWIHVEDHRGEHGWVKGEEKTIDELGPLPKGWSTEAPPPPPPEEVPDTRTTAEKRAMAYRREADPIARAIEGYRLEADACELAGDNTTATLYEGKASALLAEFLAKKKEIRERYPDEVTAEEGKK